MNPVLMALNNAITPATAGAVLSIIVAACISAYQFLMQRLPANVRSHVAPLASMVVQAVEQQANALTNGGSAKKGMAMSQFKTIANNLGIQVSDEHASAAIEAAVYAMNQVRAYQQQARASSQAQGQPAAG